MERKVVQDIVPTGRRTIRNIAPRKLPVEEEDGEEEVPMRKERMIPPQRPISPQRINPPRKRRFPSILVTFLIIFVGIALIAVALSLLYSKASVTITPKVAHFDVNGTFTAKKDPDSSLLGYDIVTSMDTLTQTVPATPGPKIETKAKGTVTLYNEQTTQQKIVAGTRLSNPDGEIYRTSVTVVIPAGKSGTPGKVDVAVIAQEAGAHYNISLSGDSNFKIVAYKDTPKYATVYARLKTAIAGGFSGSKVSISPEIQKATVKNIQESLSTKLFASAKSKVAKDSILYDGAYVIEYEIPEPVAKDAANAEITVKGTLSGASFKRNSLIKSIAAKELDKFPSPTYEISGMEDLKFTLVNSKDFSPKKGTSAVFTLKGPISLTGTFSETALKDELKGTPLKDSNTIFARYPSIANAYALITPFWMRSFPNSTDKIIIELKK